MAMTDTKLSMKFDVGRYEVELISPRMKSDETNILECVWSPHIPEKLSEEEIKEYESAKDTFLTILCAVSMADLDLSEVSKTTH